LAVRIALGLAPVQLENEFTTVELKKMNSDVRTHDFD
jgi:hypothetical protein